MLRVKLLCHRRSMVVEKINLQKRLMRKTKRIFSGVIAYSKSGCIYIFRNEQQKQ